MGGGCWTWKLGKFIKWANGHASSLSFTLSTFLSHSWCYLRLWPRALENTREKCQKKKKLNRKESKESEEIGEWRACILDTDRGSSKNISILLSPFFALCAVCFFLATNNAGSVLWTWNASVARLRALPERDLCLPEQRQREREGEGERACFTYSRLTARSPTLSHSPA